jgi:fimbrial chaperone protein
MRAVHGVTRPAGLGVRAAAALLGIAGLSAIPAQGAGFAVSASPARFELSAKPGERVGQVFELSNLDGAATEVGIRTLDWTYSEDGKLAFHDELRPGSCRPWVALERKALKIGGKDKRVFRFQIDVPKDAPRGECRFMLAVEGVTPAYQAALVAGNANLSIPVNGRLALAVYVAVGGAEPRLELSKVEMQDFDGRRRPVVVVRNTGDAHGRLEGALDGKDADGKELEIVPEGTPILPGQTRVLPLSVRAESGKAAPAVNYPLLTSGVLDWDKGSFKIEARFQ